MNRKHIPSGALKLGQRVFVVPQRAHVARGPGLDPLPAGGQIVTLSDYLFGACQRGAVLAFEPELLPAPEPAAPAIPDEEDA
jgi:hypothetical protein